jgi:hypothetical protein
MATRFSPGNLRALIGASDKKIEEIALETDRSFYALRAYLHGHCEPPSLIIGRLADALGCNVSDLFEQVDDDTMAAS